MPGIMPGNQAWIMPGKFPGAAAFMPQAQAPRGPGSQKPCSPDILTLFYREYPNLNTKNSPKSNPTPTPIFNPPINPTPNPISYPYPNPGTPTPPLNPPNRIHLLRGIFVAIRSYRRVNFLI